MAELDTVQRDAADCETDRTREHGWLLAKTLLDANAHTVRAFEQHLLRTYREDASADFEAMQSNIRQAIDEHEKIIEELEVASRAVAELQESSESPTAR